MVGLERRRAEGREKSNGTTVHGAFEERGGRENERERSMSVREVAGVISHPSPGLYNGCYRRDEQGVREGWEKQNERQRENEREEGGRRRSEARGAERVL